MNEQTIIVAEAKKHFSELLGKVAFGKKQILITKRDKPMARLVPAEQHEWHLAEAKGWLDEKVTANTRHYSRIKDLTIENWLE